jgi:hypothetical protein
MTGVGVKQAPTRLAMQCCLICGRTLTDRRVHDALEEQVLKSIGSEHPEWTNGSGACEPCIKHYRQLLDDRSTREERVLAGSRRRWPRFVVVLTQRLQNLLRPGERN